MTKLPSAGPWLGSSRRAAAVAPRRRSRGRPSRAAAGRARRADWTAAPSEAAEAERAGPRARRCAAPAEAAEAAEARRRLERWSRAAAGRRCWRSTGSRARGEGGEERGEERGEEEGRRGERRRRRPKGWTYKPWNRETDLEAGRASTHKALSAEELKKAPGPEGARRARGQRRGDYVEPFFCTGRPSTLRRRIRRTPRSTPRTSRKTRCGVQAPFAGDRAPAPVSTTLRRRGTGSGNPHRVARRGERVRRSRRRSCLRWARGEQAEGESAGEDEPWSRADRR